MNTIRGFAVKLALGAALVVLLAGLGASAALADTCTGISLTVPNADLSSATGPYACVTVIWVDSTHVSATFTADPGFQLIDGGAADLNIAGTYSLASISGLLQIDAFHAQDTTQWGNVPGQVDGFGTFDFSENFQDGGGSSVQAVTFNFLATGGNSWANAASFLTPNNGGSTAAAHIQVCGAIPCTLDNITNQTGFAANGEPVPEPATLTLLGTGLVMLGGKIRRRLRKK